MLAAFINPSRGRRKKRGKRCLTKKQLVAFSKNWGKKRCRTAGRRKPARRRRHSSIKVTPRPFEAKSPIMLNNPRRKRAKGGRSMAKKRKRRAARRGGWTKAKRRRAGRKAWRKRLRRYAKKRSSVGRRGYKNNPRKRRGSRRRRNGAGMYAGTYHSNPRKRRRKGRRRNALAIRGMYSSNPRKRRKGRRRNSHSRLRRNPFSFGGTLNGVKSALMNPDTYIQLGAAAAGGTVSMFAGAWIGSQIAGFAPETFVLGTTARKILDMVATIGSSILIGGFVPAKYRTAFILGGGAGAVKPWVDQALAPMMASVAKAAGMAGVRGPGGIGAWISVNQMPQIGMAGMAGRGGVGAWISAQQMARGFRGLGGARGGLGDAYSFEYGTPIGSLTAYDRQPYAGSGVGPGDAFSM